MIVDDDPFNLVSLKILLKLTMNKLKQPEEIINRLAVYRDAFYRSLSTFETFGRGWIRRNDETREQALEMARG